MTALKNGKNVLEVRDLDVTFSFSRETLCVVDHVSFYMAAGEVLALVGESGSGKTMIARAIMNLLPPGAVLSGDIRMNGQSLSALTPKEMRRIRGAQIGMIFQEPMVSLNPAINIGDQMAEAMRLHTDFDRKEIRRRSIEILERVRVRNAEKCLASFPHEFSGGLRQRIMLASVLMMRPAVLLADEPTTALDVLIQKEVLDIMMEVTRDMGTAVLLITHDLGVVAKYAGRTIVMRRGEFVEQGVTRQILHCPEHPYTRSLLDVLPGTESRRRHREPHLCSDNPSLLQVNDLHVVYPGRRAWPWSPRNDTVAVAGVDLTLQKGETLAIVGESGSGKTTVGRAILQLTPKASGQIVFQGQDYDAISAKLRWRLRRKMQIVFQDPFSSLDPRIRLADIVAEGLHHCRDLNRKERRARAIKALEEVDIPAALADRFPHELSGGQRQRVSIARAIVTRPTLIIADEPVSALDVTIQAQILKLFKRLKKKYELSYLFITHDMCVVEEIADRVLVMHHGRIVEEGPWEAILRTPRHPYTCALLQAVPRLVKQADGCSYEMAECDIVDTEPPAGYCYTSLAPLKTKPQPSQMVRVSSGHRVACTMK